MPQKRKAESDRHIFAGIKMRMAEASVSRVPNLTRAEFGNLLREAISETKGDIDVHVAVPKKVA